MESQKGFITDLANRSNDIIILQPAVTAGMRKFEDLKRILAASPYVSAGLWTIDRDRRVWEALHNITDMESFIHTGTLKTRCGGLHGSQMCPESYDYKYCGGFCKTTRVSVNYKERFEWHCDNCRTSISTYHLNPSMVPTILLHLLIKQMVPALRTGNFVWTEETGVVGILDDGLSYIPDSQGSDGPSWKASLGFTLMPGMQTLENLGGFDEWLRYLVQVKFDQLQVVVESQLPHLIGPKHMGELNRGLRFWR